MRNSDDFDMALLDPHACMHKETSCAPRFVLIVRTPTRKGFAKFAHKDSYKEKTSKPRKGCQSSTTI